MRIWVRASPTERWGSWGIHPLALVPYWLRLRRVLASQHICLLHIRPARSRGSRGCSDGEERCLRESLHVKSCPPKLLTASQNEPKGCRWVSVAAVTRTLCEFSSRAASSAPAHGLRCHRGMILWGSKTHTSHSYDTLIRTCLAEEARQANDSETPGIEGSRCGRQEERLLLAPSLGPGQKHLMKLSLRKFYIAKE